MWSHRTSDVLVDSSINLFFHQDLSLHAHVYVDQLVDELDLGHSYHLLDSLENECLSVCHRGNIHYSVDELDLWRFHSLLQSPDHGSLWWHRNRHIDDLVNDSLCIATGTSITLSMCRVCGTGRCFMHSVHLPNHWRLLLHHNKSASQ